MSGAADGGGRAPDSSELLLGWRVWCLGEDGELEPIVVAAEAWRRGANEAICHKRDTRHAAPAQGCVCGFNALHEPPTRLARRGLALGVIGAWGSVDVYATGFRSQFACVVGLQRDPLAPASLRERLEAAGARYGVPLLDPDALWEYALELGAPVSESLLPGRGRAPASAPRRRSARRRGPRRAAPQIRPLPSLPGGALPANFSGSGVMVGSHLAVEHRGRLMRLGPTPSLAALARGGFELRARAGARVEEGEVLFEAAATAEGRGRVSIGAPLAGTVSAVNPAVADHDSGPARDGWLLELRPEATALDGCGISWGRQGAEAYRRSVLASGSDADLLLRCSSDPVAAEELADREELRGWLRAFAQQLGTTLAANDALAAALRAFGRRTVFEVSGIESLVVAAPPVGEGRWASSLERPASEPGDLRIELGPAALLGYWRGELGLDPGDVASGEAARAPTAPAVPLRLTAGERGDLLLALSLHSRVFGEAGEILRGLGTPWFRAGDAIADPVRNLEVLAGFERPDGIAPAA